MEKTISVRLSDSLVSSISQIAKETEQTESFHIQKALELYLEERSALHIPQSYRPSVSRGQLAHGNKTHDQKRA